jgi:hypothetical protein
LRTPDAVDGGTPGSDGGVGGDTDGGSSGGATDGGTATTPDPTLIVDGPADGAVTNGTVAVTGRIQGGTPPFQVKVLGMPASVNQAYFTSSLALVEGESVAITMEATDALGRRATAQRTVSVDRTAPYLSITRPSTATAEVSESPYLVQGAVGLCLDEGCSGDGSLLKQVELALQGDGSYKLTESGAGRDPSPVQQTGRQGLGQARQFLLGLTPDLAQMTSDGVARDVYLVKTNNDNPAAQMKPIKLGRPVGGFDGANARAPVDQPRLPARPCREPGGLFTVEVLNRPSRRSQQSLLAAARGCGVDRALWGSRARRST